MRKRRMNSNRVVGVDVDDAVGAVRETDATFLVLPTPSNALGGFSLRYIRTACGQLGKALRGKRDYHVVAVVSTMLPGSSELLVIPELERYSGRKVSLDFGYCYNPAFIALGDVVRGFVGPDYVLIGESDERAGNIVGDLHRTMIENGARLARMTPTEAEITKLASNTHETMRVSFANMLLSICAELPGTNVDRVTDALSNRTGSRFFRGATPYGGPCWPRDNIALAAFMETLGIPALLPRSVHGFNDQYATYVLRKALEWTRRGETVGLLGLAYKPGTAVIDRSFAVDLAGWLVGEHRRVLAWDPLAMDEARRVLADGVAYAESGDDCLRRADVIFIVNPLNEFADLDWRQVGDKLVIDCWRCLDRAQVEQLPNYRPLGQWLGTEQVRLADKIDIRKLRLLTN